MIDYKASHYHTLLHFPFTAKCQCPKKTISGNGQMMDLLLQIRKAEELGGWREGGEGGEGGFCLSLLFMIFK